MTNHIPTDRLGALPTWDLNDLYPGRDSAEFRADLDRIAIAAKAFEDRYAGTLATLDGDALAEAIAAYERIQETIGRIGSFASLSYSGNMTDPAIGQFFQTTQEAINAATTALIFFTLTLNKLSDAELADRLKSPSLQRWQPWLRDIRAFRAHQLDDQLEKLLHEKSITGHAAWSRLFDETLTDLRFPLRGEELTLEVTLSKLSDNDRTLRAEAGQVLGHVLARHQRLFALITNTLAKDKEVEDRWRHFAAPEDSRHLSNCVEPGVVEAMVSAVRAAYPRLSHRYYALKARWFGGDRLDYYDRNAPLPQTEEADVPWAEARSVVLGAYETFSPELGAIGRRFFDHAWIDAPTRPGKASGAFAHPTVPSVHPYLLLNYQGKTRDVMTLAHELGHGVHQILAGGQGTLLSDTPLTLAETASVFGEQLTFRALLAAAPPAQRKAMLSRKVEDMLNTVVRQVAFYEFERRVHRERREGEITAERLGEIWLDVQTESLGPALRFDDGYRHFWCYIPHFIHSPFYVYAYAFGDCLVNALYAVYQDGDPDFVAKYIDMLKAGGTKRHGELLAPFGLDAGDPAFWSRGLNLIAAFIDELETL